MAEAVYRLHGLEKACVQILMSRGVLRDDELKTIIANLQPDFSDAPAAHNGNVQEILKNINDSVLPYSLCVRTVVMDEPADDSAGSDSDETESEDEPNEEGAVGADNLTQDEGGGEREGSNTGTNTRKRKQAKPARRTKKVFYHGLANAEEDFVAKQFGAAHQYQPNEVLLFNHLLHKIVTVGRAKGRMGEINMHEANLVSKDRDLQLTAVKVSATVERLEAAGWLTRDNSKGYIRIGIRSYLELQPVLEAAHAACDAACDADEVAATPEGEEGADRQEKRTYLPQVMMY